LTHVVFLLYVSVLDKVSIEIGGEAFRLLHERIGLGVL
jgi:hypothetical protein